jgi:hypothetical protein
MVECSDKHGRDAVNRRAVFFVKRGKRLARIERLAREDHRATCCHTRKHSKHHAKAVIQRHRNAKGVIFCQPQRHPDESRVIDDVAVR